MFVSTCIYPPPPRVWYLLINFIRCNCPFGFARMLMMFMKCEYSLHSKWFKTIFSECVWSFGENCQYPCGGYCIDQKCDRFNGSCLYGNCTLGNAFYANLFVKIIVWKCTVENCTVSNAFNLIQICDKIKVLYYSFGKCSIGMFPLQMYYMYWVTCKDV